MAVAVDGTGPARAAGGLLTRLLRRALVAIGLAALAWLFGMLLAPTASASATPPPTEAGSDEPAATTQSHPGLLGGVLGGLTSTVGGVLNVATTTVGGLTGAVLDTTTSVVAPVLTPPPAPPVVDEPAPAPDRANRPAPAVATPVAPVVAPAQQEPEAPAPPSPIPVSTVDIRHEPVAQQQLRIVNDTPVPTSDDQANRRGPNRLPSKAPPAPAAPAVPTSTVSSAHDGSGQARGMHGVLAGGADLDLPGEARTIRDRAGIAAGRMTGLPANTPD